MFGSSARGVLLALAVLGQGLMVFAAGVVKADMKASVSVVSYADFGARGDGKTDDSEALAKAHAFANEHGLPVRADDKATYYIGGRDQTAIIQTDTDFGTARFIIDDTALENIRAHVFEVRPAQDPVKLEGLASLQRNQQIIDVLLPGASVVIVRDQTVRRYIRRGGNQNSGTPQTDVFLADEKGNIDPNTPVLWDFDQVTEATAYPVDIAPLRINGGLFTTIANQAESKYTYHARGILIKRSNTVVDGLEHRITGEGDQGAPYNGFVSIADCANVTVQNSVFTGRKWYMTIGSAGTPVPMGSYGISISRALNISFVHCRQTNDIKDRTYWGIMGSNYSKNLLFENCTFSRFDAHQGVAKATIRHSKFGYMGVKLIGHGTFIMENTTVYSADLIGLRPDYGSTWQGEFIIRNCTFVPQGGRRGGVHLIGGSNDGQHDFGYTCYMPERITIENLHIDDANMGPNYRGPTLFANFNPAFKNSEYQQTDPYVLPREVILKNVTTASGKPLRVSDNPFMFKDVDFGVESSICSL